MMEKLLLSAAQSGLIQAPTLLLKAASLSDDALAELDKERVQFEWLAALTLEFGPAPPRPDCDPQRWEPLLRWALQALKAWEPKTDERLIVLATVALIVAACDFDDGEFWSHLSSGAICSPALLDFAEKRLSNLSILATVPASAPLWETELLSDFRAADANSDWVEVDQYWPRLRMRLDPNLLVNCFTRLLAFFNFEALARTTDRVKGFLAIQAIMQALPIEQRMHLGQRTANKAGRFAAIYSSAAPRWRRESLSDTEEEAASLLLVEVAQDLAEWKKWMAVFNTYPLRYPSLQRPLGKALASLTDEAIEVYINALHLSSSCDGSRSVVAVCLKCFADAATEERRKVFWSKAHSRWARWKFNQDDQDHYLFRIGCSEIDFAVVGYFVECMDESQRQKEIEKTLGLIERTELTWHASASAYTTSYYRELSHLQPCAHAQTEKLSHENWLSTKPYLPTWDTASRYRAIRN